VVIDVGKAVITTWDLGMRVVPLACTPCIHCFTMLQVVLMVAISNVWYLGHGWSHSCLSPSQAWRQVGFGLGWEGGTSGAPSGDTRVFAKFVGVAGWYSDSRPQVALIRGKWGCGCCIS
jgi:hypothetical protein